MPLKHAILGLLNYKDMTGYDIDRKLSTPIIFFWHAQTSQVYKELNALTKSNWVVSETVVQTDKPNKKVFSITDEGRYELKRWIGDTDMVELMKYKNPLLIKIFFSSNIEVDGIMRLLNQYIRECEAVIGSMNEELPQIPAYEEDIHRDNESFYWGMTMTYGFMYYQNEIKWAKWCIDKLKEKI